MGAAVPQCWDRAALVDRFEVRKLEARTFPWSLRAIADSSGAIHAVLDTRIVSRLSVLWDHPAICVLDESGGVA